MTDSILDSTKKVLGLDPTYTAFDEDVIMHINSTLATLFQLGIGPTTGFEIASDAETWMQFLGAADPTLNMVKSYVFLRVKLLFDPPPTSYAIQAMERQLDELGFRLNARREEVKYPWTPPAPTTTDTVW